DQTEWIGCILAENLEKSFIGLNSCQNGILGSDFATVHLRQPNVAKPPKTRVLDLKSWIGCALAEKHDNSFVGRNSCQNGIIGPDFTTEHLRQPNGGKPPKT